MKCPTCGRDLQVAAFAHATFYVCGGDDGCSTYSDMTGQWFQRDKGKLDPQPGRLRDFTAEPKSDAEVDAERAR